MYVCVHEFKLFINHFSEAGTSTSRNREKEAVHVNRAVPKQEVSVPLRGGSVSIANTIGRKLRDHKQQVKIRRHVVTWWETCVFSE